VLLHCCKGLFQIANGVFQIFKGFYQIGKGFLLSRQVLLLFNTGFLHFNKGFYRIGKGFYITQAAASLTATRTRPSTLATPANPTPTPLLAKELALLAPHKGNFPQPETDKKPLPKKIKTLKTLISTKRNEKSNERHNSPNPLNCCFTMEMKTQLLTSGLLHRGFSCWISYFLLLLFWF